MNDDRRCRAKAKGTGNRCKRAAIAGGTVCAMHGGKSPQALKKATLRVAQEKAQVLVDRLGGRIDISPEQAVLDLIAESAANLAVYRRLVEAVASPAELALTSPPHPYLALYDQERDRLFGFAATASKIGLSEKIVRIAQRQGEKLVEVLEAVWTDPELGLTANDLRRMRPVMVRHLQAVKVEGPHVGLPVREAR